MRWAFVSSRKAPSSHPGRDARPAKGAKGPAVPGVRVAGRRRRRSRRATASTFSLATIGTITSAATGSAHHQPKKASQEHDCGQAFDHRVNPEPDQRCATGPDPARNRYHRPGGVPPGGEVLQQTSAPELILSLYGCFHVVQSGEVDVSAVCLRRVEVSARVGSER